MERVAQHWNRLSGDMESPSPQVFKRHVDVTLGDRVLVVSLTILG